MKKAKWVNSVKTSSKNTNSSHSSSQQTLPKLQVNTFVETIRRLLRRGALANVGNIMQKSHPADIALTFRHLDPEEQWQVFLTIDDKSVAAEVLTELEENELRFFIERIPEKSLVELMTTLPPDDATDILNVLPQDLANDILSQMKKDQSSQVAELLNYDEKTAGGIMVPNYFALHENTTAKQAIDALQESTDKEMVFYIYVTDDAGHLVGVLSLRQLLMMPATKKLKDVMNTHAVFVRTDTDQEDVARMVSRYNILAVPVVDNTNKLVGIITVDDVIDVLREEATEDMLRMAGAGDDNIDASFQTFVSVRQRSPWLLASCIGGVISLVIISRFENLLNTVIILAGFIPVIVGMGGNVGTQSSTIVVRGLAMKRINLSHTWKILFREMRISLVMGTMYGGILAAYTLMFHQEMPLLGVVVGSSLLLSMVISATIGSLLPMIFQRLNIDPAVATGPFITTSTDIIGVLIYLLIATAFLAV